MPSRSRMPSRHSSLPPMHRCADDPPQAITPDELLLARKCRRCRYWAERLMDDVSAYDPVNPADGDYALLVADLWNSKSHQNRLWLLAIDPELDLPLWPLVPRADEWW